MRHVVKLFAALFLLVGSFSASGAVIQGTVQNGSRKMQPIPKCTVRLLWFSRHTFQQKLIDSTVTSRSGRFRFSHIKPDSHAVYVATAEYLGLPYFSDIAHILRPDTTVTLTVTAYDTTSEPPIISVQMHHVFADRDTSDMHFREVLVITSNSQKTYIGQSAGGHYRKTLAFSIPSGAYAFQAEMGLDMNHMAQEGNTVYDVQPLAPGTKRVSYSYRLPLDNGTVTYARTIDYSTNVFSFFVSDPSVKVESSELAETEPLAIRGREYQRWEADNLSPGTVVTVTLRTGGSLVGKSGPWLAALGILVLAVVVVGALARARRRTAPATETDPRLKQHESLMHEIAALDDAYEEGKIPEDEYKTKRKALKEQLVKLTNDLMSSSRGQS
ncbi:MAG: carboxypeptidase regulatory-like domain-containing protein [Calditrichaeota bacterium]|nr:carboxypeptidase regulatory-like domain-containing protein [Calditrichota bacterium]